MRVLVIGQPDSAHTASFLKRFKTALEPSSILLFPSTPMPVSKDVLAIAEVPVRNRFEGKIHPKIYWRDMIDNPLSVFSGDPVELRALIKSYNPTHIHVNAIQDAGYLLEACFDASFDSSSFVLSLSIWGIDLAFFRHSESHRAKIVSLLSYVDRVFPECSRDINICRELGYAGSFASIMQATLKSAEDFFLDVNQYSQNLKSNHCIIKNDPYSNRSFSHIFLHCILGDDELLRDFRFSVIAPSQGELELIDAICCRRGPVVSITGVLDRHSYLSLLSTSKLLVSLTLSDGIPNSFLEALSLGVFPFFSSFSGLKDWQSRALFSIVNPYSMIEIREALMIVDSLVRDEREFSAHLMRNRDSLDIYSEVKLNASLRKAF